MQVGLQGGLSWLGTQLALTKDSTSLNQLFVQEYMTWDLIKLWPNWLESHVWAVAACCLYVINQEIRRTETNRISLPSSASGGPSAPCLDRRISLGLSPPNKPWEQKRVILESSIKSVSEVYKQMCNYLVSDRSCSLIRWIHCSSSGALYDARYSSRSLLKKVGDSPALALLPSGNRGNKGLIHILVWRYYVKGLFHNWTLHLDTVHTRAQTHPCVFWYQSALMRLEVRMMTLKPSSYHSSIIFLLNETQQVQTNCNGSHLVVHLKGRGTQTIPEYTLAEPVCFSLWQHQESDKSRQGKKSLRVVSSKSNIQLGLSGRITHISPIQRQIQTC